MQAPDAPASEVLGTGALGAHGWGFDEEFERKS
jgi:hypothetical protein